MPINLFILIKSSIEFFLFEIYYTYLSVALPFNQWMKEQKTVSNVFFFE